MNRVLQVVLMLALTGCGGYGDGNGGGYGGPSTSGTGSVELHDASFAPGTVYPAAGGQVTWTWKTGVTHNITFEGAITGSGDHNAGSFTHVFAGAGSYRYRCTIHSTDFTHGMVGVVIVPDPGSGGGYPTE